MTRRALGWICFLLLGFVFPLAAQDSASMPKNSQQAAAASGTGQPTALRSLTPGFDERDAAAVLNTIRDGLEGHSQRRFLSAFDGDKMDGFLSFEDQIDAYFNSYVSFRVTLRIVQTSEENHRGVILADFQVENEPRGGGRISSRQGQLRFELERGAKGWKIVDFNPREFFS